MKDYWRDRLALFIEALVVLWVLGVLWVGAIILGKRPNLD